MNDNKQFAKKINQLLIRNVEKERILLSLLDEVDNSLLKNFIRLTAYERNQFIKALDTDLRQNGITPTYPEDSLANNLNKSLDLNEAITQGDNILIFNKLGKIQIKDIEKYKKIINNLEMPESTEVLLNQQLDTLIKSLYSIEIHKDILSRTPISA